MHVGSTYMYVLAFKDGGILRPLDFRGRFDCAKFGDAANWRGRLLDAPQMAKSRDSAVASNTSKVIF